MDNNGKHGNLKSNWQEHDVWYVVDRVQEIYWREPWQLIQQVVSLCKVEVKPTEGRERLLAVAKEKMRLLIEARGHKPDQRMNSSYLRVSEIFNLRRIGGSADRRIGGSAGAELLL